MKNFFDATWKAAGISITTAVFLTAVFLYYSYSTLLSSRSIAVITGPQEGYYWIVSQYQIYFERLENQLLRFSIGGENDAPKIDFNHQLLASKFDILTKPSDLTNFFNTVDQYHEKVAKLQVFMTQLDNGLPLINSDRQMVNHLLDEFGQARVELAELANIVHLEELKIREQMTNDFYQKRRLLYTSASVLWLFFVAWVALLLTNIRRSFQLIQRQEQTIIAERRATAAVQDAVNAKNAFLGMVSHEIRTPLHTITSSIELLSLRGLSEKNNQVIHRLEVASQHLTAQMKDLTDYARINSGRMELRKEQFNPYEIAQYTIDDQIEVAHKKGLGLALSSKGTIREVISDPHRISQIMGNLVENAVKYTETGSISVVISMPSNPALSLEISVSDTGIGIDTEKLAVLFEPFTQLDQSSTRRHEGTGLGLAIVKGLVTHFEGTIEVDSEPGKGSHFKIVIPVEPGHSTNFVVPQGLNCEGKISGRILVVDDHTEILASFQEMLEELGFQAEIANNGNDAIDKLRLQPYDIVLLDINMPEKDGYQVAKEIRDLPGLNHPIPIIGISAYSAVIAGDSQLFDAYLTKPVRCETLFDTLKKVINKARLNQSD